jgi:hypothetical protein
VWSASIVEGREKDREEKEEGKEGSVANLSSNFVVLP